MGDDYGYTLGYTSFLSDASIASILMPGARPTWNTVAEAQLLWHWKVYPPMEDLLFEPHLEVTFSDACVPFGLV